MDGYDSVIMIRDMRKDWNLETGGKQRLHRESEDICVHDCTKNFYLYDTSTTSELLRNLMRYNISGVTVSQSVQYLKHYNMWTIASSESLQHIDRYDMWVVAISEPWLQTQGQISNRIQAGATSQLSRNRDSGCVVTSDHRDASESEQRRRGCTKYRLQAEKTDYLPRNQWPHWYPLTLKMQADRCVYLDIHTERWRKA